MRALPVLLTALLAPGLASAYDEPAYSVIAERDGYEIRRYGSYVVAETVVEGSFDEAGEIAFRRLFSYISGDNRGSRDIEMTTPVISREADRETIPMTAPVISESAGGEPGASDSYVYQFVMPAELTLEVLPSPSDPEIALRQVPESVVAVRRFTGRWVEGNYRRAESALLEALSRAGIATLGGPRFARYNGPFMPWFLRRNEVIVEVDPATLDANS